jgi:hypothetical protein
MTVSLSYVGFAHCKTCWRFEEDKLKLALHGPSMAYGTSWGKL